MLMKTRYSYNCNMLITSSHTNDSEDHMKTMVMPVMLWSLNRPARVTEVWPELGSHDQSLQLRACVCFLPKNMVFFLIFCCFFPEKWKVYESLQEILFEAKMTRGSKMSCCEASITC